ncbi:MAG: hypothetical protein ACOC0U_00515 [Desulfovibrionales bacterium]
MRSIGILFAFLLFTSACDHVRPQIGPQIVYDDAEVQLSQLQISENPGQFPDQPLTALFIPLRVMQRMEGSITVGNQISDMLVREWGRMNVFPDLKTLEGRWPGLENGLALSRNLGRDLLVTGTIPYFNFSGTEGATTVSLHLEVFDGQTGDLLWSMEQAGRITGDFDEDYILVRRKTRMPLDPVSVIVSSLAQETGVFIKSWNRGRFPPQPSENGPGSLFK